MLQVQPRPSLTFRSALSAPPMSVTMEQTFSFDSVQVYNCGKGRSLPQFLFFSATIILSLMPHRCGFRGKPLYPPSPTGSPPPRIRDGKSPNETRRNRIQTRAGRPNPMSLPDPPSPFRAPGNHLRHGCLPLPSRRRSTDAPDTHARLPVLARHCDQHTHSVV